MAGDALQRPLIGQILKEMGLVTEAQIQEALTVQREARAGLIGEFLVTLGHAKQDQIHRALSAQIAMELLRIAEIPPGSFEWAAQEPPEVVFDSIPGEGADPPPVVKLISMILSTALGANATEIRFDLGRDRFDVRYRVDGVLYDMESPPTRLAPPLFQRLRRLTGLTEGTMHLSARFDGRRYRVSATSVRGDMEEAIVLGFSLIS